MTRATEPRDSAFRSLKKGGLTRRYLPPLARFRLLGAGLGGGVGLLVLLGYATDFESAWLWSAGLPSMHPSTALCIALLSLGASAGIRAPRLWRWSATAAIVAATALLLLRLARPAIGATALDMLTPFKGVLAAHPQSAGRVHMAGNTGCALLAIAVGEMLRRGRRVAASQTMACIALGIAFATIVGYTDGLVALHGGMSPQTTLGVILLATATLFATPRHGFVRVLTERSHTAALARRLLSVGTLGALAIGWVVLWHLTGAGRPAVAVLFVYQTTAIVILTWVLVTVGLVRADQIAHSRRTADRAVIRVARTDALTGLLSRDWKLTLGGEADGPRPAAGLFIDLDRFRSTNEAFGHEAGDRVLIEVGQRLASVAGGHVLARLGADEFVMYCPGITVAEAARIGLAATDLLAKPFALGGRNYYLTASIGIAHTDATGATDLQQAADDAMYVAKLRGGNQAVIFAPTMHNARKIEAELEQELHASLNHGDDLALVYQPVVRIADRAMIAVEALARWTHPCLGVIPPERFIQLAERTGLIVPLGLKLMQMAVRQAAQWTARYPSHCPIININVSPLQFAAGDVIGDLVTSLQEHGLSASGFCIEVTEGVFTGEPVIRALEAARRIGFHVAMDDFGVGYSALSRLPRLPLSSVKLDRSFVVHAAESADDATMLAAITQLAHALGLSVTAEGVEHPEQLEMVTACGCDAVQGFVFSHPLPPDAISPWLSASRQDDPVAANDPR